MVDDNDKNHGQLTTTTNSPVTSRHTVIGNLTYTKCQLSHANSPLLQTHQVAIITALVVNPLQHANRDAKKSNYSRAVGLDSSLLLFQRLSPNVNKKLSCRRETVRRFVSLNILLSHSK